MTILTRNRECLLGTIEDNAVTLSDIGKKGLACWKNIPEHFPCARLGAFVIMPNHIHGIIELLDQEQKIGSNGGNGTQESGRAKEQRCVRAQNLVPLHRRHSQIKNQYSRDLHYKKINQFQQIIPRSIGSIVKGFKIGVTKYCHTIGHLEPVWHRNYYERIIRSKAELIKIRKYIINNPKNWEKDKKHPSNNQICH